VEDRAPELLLSRTKTALPPTTLGQLRRERSLTQSQIAGSLRIQQASIAKLEKRSDILVSTLQAIVTAMGGRLRIRAVFPDGLERELHFTPSARKKEERV
jgi:transcriptional regulator with XRE-family HTH domain